MSILSVTLGKDKPRKKSVIGVDLGVFAIGIGCYGEHGSDKEKDHKNEHSHEKEEHHENLKNSHENLKHSQDHNSPTTVTTTEILKEVTQSPPLDHKEDGWKCRYHHSGKHEIFISYRVNADAELAEKLVDQFHLQKKAQQEGIRVFLDKRCLPVGEDWQTSFLNGLMKSDVIVLLISRASIDNFKQAHTRQDNVLLEYEYALQRLNEEPDGAQRKVKVIPVLVGRKIKITVDDQETEVFQKFQFPNLNDFPDEPHKVGNVYHSPKKQNYTVREVLKHIFSLQGIFLNDLSNLTGLIVELMDVI